LQAELSLSAASDGFLLVLNFKREDAGHKIFVNVYLQTTRRYNREDLPFFHSFFSLALDWHRDSIAT
jgi:hypothetical protein